MHAGLRGAARPAWLPMLRVLPMLSVLLLAAMLTACATHDSDVGPARFAGFPPAQNQINLQGRMSVMYQQGGKDEALHGKFEWHQKQNEIAIVLRSPLGETLAQIFVTPGGARIRQAGAPEREAADIDTLMAQTLGWPLPVAGLRDWLQGQVPGAVLQNNMARSQGWHIHFVSRHPNGSPKRIDLERYSTEAGEVKLRLIIDGPE